LKELQEICCEKKTSKPARHVRHGPRISASD
jgi:hypothetical protein